MSRRGMSALFAVACSLSAVGSLHAEPVTLRMAAIAPDGTEWARALRAFAAEVETETHGELKLKWYLGGIAGDELTALDRIKRGQLDGEAGAIFCQKLAPSLRAMRLAGLFESHEEMLYVMGRLKPTFDEEMRKAGFYNFGESFFGSDALFSRKPIRSLDDLRNMKIWVWNLDPVWQEVAEAMGLHTVVTTLEEHSPAWRRGQYDAFFVVPTAALAYQWSTEASYYTDLSPTLLPACMVMSNAAMDPLPNELRQALKGASAKFLNRFTEISIEMQGSLTNGLFDRQGVKHVPLSPALRRDFYAAAKEARIKLGAALVAPSLLAEVEKMLAEYRATHHAPEAARP